MLFNFETTEELKEQLDEYGLIEGVDYVINESDNEED